MERKKKEENSFRDKYYSFLLCLSDLFTVHFSFFLLEEANTNEKKEKTKEENYFPTSFIFCLFLCCQIKQ